MNEKYSWLMSLCQQKFNMSNWIMFIIPLKSKNPEKCKYAWHNMVIAEFSKTRILRHEVSTEDNKQNDNKS